MPKKKMVPKKTPDASTYSGRFAARLYALRKKAGLSAEQVAEELGLSPMAIYYWETGRRQPKISDLPKIAEVLKLKKIKDLYPNE